jgi:TRAP-type C4-dicarboxylate transport system permease small subunit
MLRNAMTSAIAYWERARIVYNLVLALVVLGYFAAAWPGSWNRITMDHAQGLFLLAVPANVAYCAAYPVDVFAQLSGFRAAWLKVRGLLLVVGIVFAAILTRFLCLGFFFGGA